MCGGQPNPPHPHVSSYSSAVFLRAPLVVILLVACRSDDTSTRAAIQLVGPVECADKIGTVTRGSVLTSGKLALIDYGAPALLLLDCAPGSVDTIGGEGSGPGEYLRPVAVSPTANGGVSILDRSTARMTTWDSTFQVVGTEPVPQEYLNYDTRLGSDGAVYFTDAPAATPVYMSPRDRPGRPTDSSFIYRAFAGETGFDTVASIVIRGAEWIGQVAKLTRRFDTEDAWGVLPDGGLWIARSRENRVDLVTAEGSVTVGQASPWEPVPAGQADVRMMRNLAGPPPDSIPWPMAEVKAPFEEAIAAPDGEVWTKVIHAAGHSAQEYRVFETDRRDSVHTVTIEPGDWVVAVGKTHVYVASDDADGFVTITAYQRPRLPDE